MKKKVIFSIVLIIAGILIVIVNKIIGNFDWHLRSDFIWLASFMITFGVFWLGILSLKDVKKEGVKIFFTLFWTLISIIVAFVEFMVLCWIIKTTTIKEIDGIKYCGVEYETNRLRKNVYYYKEYNIFAYHETKEHIEEFYDYDDYEHPLYREYYDENSRCKIIYEFDKSGNIIEIFIIGCFFYNINYDTIKTQKIETF